MRFDKLTKRAKQVVDKRGGMDALKEDAGELREIAKGKGSVKDKAKEAAKAVKDPGTKGPEPDRHGGPSETGGTPEGERSK